METWKKVLLFVIVPAFITGLFSFAPKIVDIITEPIADLSYSINEGPSLELDGYWRKVVSIHVLNTGKLSLNNIYAEIIIKNGIIENSELNDYLGLKPEIIKSKNSTIIKIQKLHKNEKITFSSMLLLSTPDTKMSINIRSDELRATLTSLDDKRKNDDKYSSLLSAFLSGFSVLLMSSLALITLRKGNFRFLPFFQMKQDLILYILFRSGFTDTCKTITHSENNYSYMRVADILFIEGITNPEIKNNSIKGLRSLLLIKSIAKMSQEIIIDNLKRLEGESYSADLTNELTKKAINAVNLLEIRQLIDDTIFESKKV